MEAEVGEKRDVGNDEWDGKLYTRDDLEHAFKTDAYLDDFYNGKVPDSAMKFVLQFLPVVATRLPEMERYLDFGAGPTCYVAMVFRNKAHQIYLADYLQQNRDELLNWVQKKSRVDWTATARMIASAEGNLLHSITMEEDARRKVEGILSCDMHRANPLACNPMLEPVLFDMVSSILCVEYSCLNEAEYRNAIRNICGLVKPGGYFLVSGVMEETWCGFGGMRFAQLFLTEELLLSSLDEAGIETSGPHFTYLNADGIYMVCGKKRESNKEDKAENSN